MAAEKWDLDDKGNLKLFPIAGWNIANLAKGMFGAVRVEYCTEPTLRERKFIQLVMKPEQVRELSQALNRLADAMEKSAHDSAKGEIRN